MRRSYCILIIITLMGCNNLTRKDYFDICQDNRYPGFAEDVTLEDSLKIRKLNGLFVQVEGILHYNFEDVAIYPIGKPLINQALWIELLAGVIDESKLIDLNGKHIVAVGKIDITRKGHYSAYLATLDSVYCIQNKK